MSDIHNHVCTFTWFSVSDTKLRAVKVPVPVYVSRSEIVCFDIKELTGADEFYTRSQVRCTDNIYTQKAMQIE